MVIFLLKTPILVEGQKGQFPKQLGILLTVGGTSDRKKITRRNSCTFGNIQRHSQMGHPDGVFFLARYKGVFLPGTLGRSYYYFYALGVFVQVII